MAEDSQERHSHELKHLKSAALAVALTNKKPVGKKYEEYKDNLVKQLEESGEEIVGDPKAFYKEGVKSPAGYVIETNQEVFVCYHGTQFGKVFGSGGKEILHDLQVSGAKMKFGEEEEVSVHSGFKKEFMASKASMYNALSQTNAEKKGVHLSGHSLGAAVAQIAAMDLSINNPDKWQIKRVTTFGGPRVFQKKAADLYNSKGLGDVTLRVKQDIDLVTCFGQRGLYHHVGKKIKVPSPKAGVHSGSVYREIAKNMKDIDVENARPSDNPWSFKELYLNPVMQMTKETFAKIQNIGTVVDKIRATLSSYTKSAASGVNSPMDTPAMRVGNTPPQR
ncbi:MAG: lipase family protein [Rickettsiaceae bacterium]|nr:lipase family protein [Rickettsiaceae bacterium]